MTIDEKIEICELLKKIIYNTPSFEYSSLDVLLESVDEVIIDLVNEKLNEAEPHA